MYRRWFRPASGRTFFPLQVCSLFHFPRITRHILIKISSAMSSSMLASLIPPDDHLSQKELIWSANSARSLFAIRCAQSTPFQKLSCSHKDDCRMLQRSSFSASDSGSVKSFKTSPSSLKNGFRWQGYQKHRARVQRQSANERSSPCTINTFFGTFQSPRSID